MDCMKGIKLFMQQLAACRWFSFAGKGRGREHGTTACKSSWDYLFNRVTFWLVKDSYKWLENLDAILISTHMR